MKKLISILIIVVVLATLVLTCPDKESHMDAINNELITVIDTKMNLLQLKKMMRKMTLKRA